MIDTEFRRTAENYRNNKTEQNARELFYACDKYVSYFVRRYMAKHGGAIDSHYDDLVKEAKIKLFNSLDDVDFDNNPINLLSKRMLKSLNEYRDKNTGMVSIPSNVKTMIYRIRNRMLHDSSLDLEEEIDKTTESEVFRKALRHYMSEPKTKNENISIDFSEDGEIEEIVFPSEDDVVSNVSYLEIKKQYNIFLKNSSQRERDILSTAIGFNTKYKTLKSLSPVYGITCQAVHQEAQRILKKLRLKIRAMNC